MRTPPRLMTALAAVAGLGLLSGANPASAQNINLNTCSSWSIVGGVFSCTPTTTGGGGNTTVAAPSGCAVNVSPSSGAAGTSVAVSATGSRGTAPTSHSWTGGVMQ